MANSNDMEDKRWEGVRRVYTKQDVEKLRGSIKIEHTLARMGAERLWKLLHSEPYVHALGALTGNQAVQQVQGTRNPPPQCCYVFYLNTWVCLNRFDSCLTPFC